MRPAARAPALLLAEAVQLACFPSNELQGAQDPQTSHSQPSAQQACGFGFRAVLRPADNPKPKDTLHCQRAAGRRPCPVAWLSPAPLHPPAPHPPPNRAAADVTAVTPQRVPPTTGPSSSGRFAGSLQSPNLATLLQSPQVAVLLELPQGCQLGAQGPAALAGGRCFCCSPGVGVSSRLPATTRSMWPVAHPAALPLPSCMSRFLPMMSPSCSRPSILPLQLGGSGDDPFKSPVFGTMLTPPWAKTNPATAQGRWGPTVVPSLLLAPGGGPWGALPPAKGLRGAWEGAGGLS